MYVSIDGQNVYYQKIGNGKDLMLLHGWGQDVSTWYGCLDGLKKNFTLWLIDLPGFGRSDVPRKPFKILDYSEIIFQFIKKLNLKKPNIIGHSVGGRIAIKLAVKHPEVLNKLILESSAGVQPKRDLIKYLIYPFAKFFHYLIPDIFNLKEKLRLRFYKKLESDYLTSGPLKETLTNILKEDLTKDLSKIKNETLLIWGEKDPTKESSLRNGKLMYKLIPNSRIEVLEGVEHFPHLESPERFVYYVKDFI